MQRKPARPAESESESESESASDDEAEVAVSLALPPSRASPRGGARCVCGPRTSAPAQGVARSHCIVHRAGRQGNRRPAGAGRGDGDSDSGSEEDAGSSSGSDGEGASGDSSSDEEESEDETERAKRELADVPFGVLQVCARPRSAQRPRRGRWFPAQPGLLSWSRRPRWGSRAALRNACFAPVHPRARRPALLPRCGPEAVD